MKARVSIIGITHPMYSDMVMSGLMIATEEDVMNVDEMVKRKMRCVVGGVDSVGFGSRTEVAASLNSEFRILNFEFRVPNFEFRVPNFEFRISNFEFRVRVQNCSLGDRMRWRPRQSGRYKETDGRRPSSRWNFIRGVKTGSFRSAPSITITITIGAYEFSRSDGPVSIDLDGALGHHGRCQFTFTVDGGSHVPGDVLLLLKVLPFVGNHGQRRRRWSVDDVIDGCVRGRKHGISVEPDAYRSWRRMRKLPSLTQVLGWTGVTPTTTDGSYVGPIPQQRGLSTSSAIDVDNGSVQETVADPTSFAHVVDLIRSGKPMAGIRDIPDTVRDGDESQSILVPRRKPWEGEERHDRRGHLSLPTVNPGDCDGVGPTS